MSYGYVIKREMYTPPKRPLGVAILATLGILAGLANVVVVLINAFISMRQDFSLVALGADLSIGLGAALVVIWIYWGLWDQMSWAWWMTIFLNILSIALLIMAVRYAPTITQLLPMLVPLEFEVTPTITAGLISGAVFLLILTIAITVYLVAVREAFGIGTKHLRPPWER